MRQRLTIVMMAFAMAALVPGVASGAETSRLAVGVAEACEAGGNVETLVGALRTRLKEREVVRVAGPTGLEGEASTLEWSKGGTGRCRLVLVERGGETSSRATVGLAKKAEEATIRNTASRVAWLLSTSGELGSEESGESGSEESGESGSEESGESGESEESKESEESEESGESEKSKGSTAATDTGDGDVFSTGTRVPFRATVVPLASYPFDGPDRAVPAYAMNFVGHSYGLDGVEVGLIFNHETAFARGVQGAVVGNWVGGPTRGLQVSTALNVSTGTMQGAALTSGLNVSGDLAGLQVSAGGNLAVGDAAGVQMSAGFNWTTGRVQGVQLANVNVAGDVAGLQAGLLNVGREVDGLQLGLLNIAKRSEVSLGLVNINWDRPAYLLSWMNETGLVSAGVQHGSEHVYHIVRAGYQPFGPNRLVVPGVGFGGHFPLGSLGTVGTYLETDLMYNVALPVNSERIWPAHWGQLRLTFGMEFTRRLGAFAGVSVNAIGSPGAPATFSAPEALPSVDLTDGPALWPGFYGGVRF